MTTIYAAPYRPRLLVSYFYFADEGALDFLDGFDDVDVFADSGAFSAFNTGKPLDVAQYADWLLEHKRRFAVYANLDVKGDLDASLRNQAYLERQGLRPIPVFHAGEPWSVFNDMMKDYGYIALGGVAGALATSEAIFKWLIKCFKLARDNDVVFHGFGMTTWLWLKSLPWYSVDSSSWGAGFRYGNVRMFDPVKAKFIGVRLGNAKQNGASAGLIRACLWL